MGKSEISSIKSRDSTFMELQHQSINNNKRYNNGLLSKRANHDLYLSQDQNSDFSARVTTHYAKVKYFLNRLRQEETVYWKACVFNMRELGLTLARARFRQHGKERIGGTFIRPLRYLMTAKDESSMKSNLHDQRIIRSNKEVPILGMRGEGI